MSKEMLHLLCMVWAQEATISKHGSEYSFTMKDLERKVLVSTSRPKRIQEFMNVERFFSIWNQHNSLFEKERPEISLSYTKMPVTHNDIAESIPIDLSNPIQKQNSLEMKLQFRDQIMKEGKYKDCVLFIDWIPTPYCPKSIAKLFPELADI